jgi:bifunctional non-homologous end joining protein LigD
VAQAFPEWLEPMAATLTQERFTGPDWLFERKLDGIRLLAFKRGSTVHLYSRNRLLQNDRYPTVVEAIEKLPVKDAILDGEATGVWGSHPGKTTFHVFDVLRLDGRDVTLLPLVERRALLAALPLRAPLARVPAIDEDKPWERACAEGWEGVIAKRRDAPYEHKRSRHWLKMKCEASQELVIGGFTDPQGGRKGLGALLVGYFEGDDFVFAGKVGTGFDDKLLRMLRAQLGALEVDRAPFTKGTGLPRDHVHWTKPELVVEVAFMEWTGHGKLRHPRLVRMRDDKPAREVTREIGSEPP